jgi:hypothetical protein
LDLLAENVSKDQHAKKEAEKGFSSNPFLKRVAPAITELVVVFLVFDRNFLTKKFYLRQIHKKHPTQP